MKITLGSVLICLIGLAPVSSTAQTTVGEVYTAIRVAEETVNYVNELARQYGGTPGCLIMATQGCRTEKRCLEIHKHIRGYKKGDPPSFARLAKAYKGTSSMSSSCTRALTGWPSNKSEEGLAIHSSLLAYAEAGELENNDTSRMKEILLENAPTSTDRRAVEALFGQ